MYNFPENLKPYYEELVHLYVKEIETFVKETQISSFPAPLVKLDWNPNRRSSRGGLYKPKGVQIPGINLAMHYSIGKISRQPYRFYEYASFDNHPEIGGFYSDVPEHYTVAIVCHEMAHAVQYWSDKFIYKRKTAPHGIEFKGFYRTFRKKFLNVSIPDQREMKEKYDSLVKKIQIK